MKNCRISKIYFVREFLYDRSYTAIFELNDSPDDSIERIFFI